MTDIIFLPERLDITTVTDVTTRLREHADGTDIRVDAMCTEHIGVLGAQVLLSAKRTFEAEGKSFAVINLQDHPRKQLSSLGMPELSQPEDQK